MKRKYSYKINRFSETDNNAVKAYCSIHNIDEKRNMGDMHSLSFKRDFSVSHICCSTPCVDFSLAGKQKGCLYKCLDCGNEYDPFSVIWLMRNKCPVCGSENIEKNQSSLLIDLLTAIGVKHPKFILFENVPELAKTHTFDKFLHELGLYGYISYYEVLNASDFGLPQNRKRLYLAAIDKYYYNDKFKFPKPIKTSSVLNDYLDINVPERYYISDEQAAELEMKNKKVLTTYSHTLLCDNNYKRFENSRYSLVHDNGRYRKIMPIEYVRLMGFDDGAYIKIRDMGFSDKAIYKLFGNSVCTNVLLAVYAQLFYYYPQIFESLKVMSLCSGVGAYEFALKRLYTIINQTDTKDEVMFYVNEVLNHPMFAPVLADDKREVKVL